MLDMKFLRTHFAEIQEKLKYRGEDLTEFEHFEELDKTKRNN